MYKKQVVCETNDIFKLKMYFFTYLFLIHKTPPASPLVMSCHVSNINGNTE